MIGVDGFASRLIARAEWVMGLEPGVIMTSDRTAEVSLARACVACVLFDELELSKMKIGKILGVDHTSVMHSVKVTRKKENEGDWDTVDLVEDLIEFVKAENRRRVG